MWEVLLLGRGCCPRTSSSPFTMACHLFSLPSCVILCFRLAGVFETERLGVGGGERWRWGAFLKGIITVSPENVHNHSVKQTGAGREEGIFPFDFLLEFFAPIQFYKTASGEAALWLYLQFIWWNRTAGGKFYESSAVFALRRPSTFSPLNGWVALGPLICAVGSPGYRLGRLAAWQCDCLIGYPLKAM